MKKAGTTNTKNFTNETALSAEDALNHLIFHEKTEDILIKMLKQEDAGIYL